jgi:hypothetical protein
MKPKKSTRLDIFARGGDEVTSRSRFLKQLDSFRTDSEKTDFAKTGKGGAMSKLSGETKSEKPIKPRGRK